MPAAGIDVPLVQLLANSSRRPLRHRPQRGAGVDLASVYGSLAAQVDGGLDAGTRSRRARRGRRAGLDAGDLCRRHRTVKGDLLRCAAPSCPSRSMATAMAQAHATTRAIQRDGAMAMAMGVAASLGDRLVTAQPILGHALGAGLLVPPVHAARGVGVPGPRPVRYDLSVVDEALQLFSLGVQGLFIDQPDLAWPRGTSSWDATGLPRGA